MAKSNGKNLVIVESPAKAKTINKYLGDDYIVKAQHGPRPRPARPRAWAWTSKTFVPEYEVLEEPQGKVVSELKKLAKDSDRRLPGDRLGPRGRGDRLAPQGGAGHPGRQRVQRVIFNAITKTEIQKAFENPHAIDIDRVNAQQARRILDRIVGYEISPAAVAEGRQGPERRPRAERGGAAGRRARARDRSVHPRRSTGRSAAIFTADGRPPAASSWPSEWIDFLTNTGNGERTKLEREKWLARARGVRRRAGRAGGQEVRGRTTRTDARKAAELLGFVVDKDETTEDAEAKGPAKNLTTLIGRLGKLPAVHRPRRSRRSARPASRRPPFITSTLQQAAVQPAGLRRAADDAASRRRCTRPATSPTCVPTRRNLSAEALTMARSYIGKRVRRQVPAGEAELLRLVATRARRKPTRRSARPTRASRRQQAHAKLGAGRVQAVPARSGTASSPARCRRRSSTRRP